MNITFEKACEAVKRYIASEGMDFIETYEDMIVADDHGDLVFIDVRIRDGRLPEDGFIGRSALENITVNYLMSHPETPSNVYVRFDIASLAIIGVDRAFMRYRRNALGGDDT